MNTLRASASTLNHIADEAAECVRLAESFLNEELSAGIYARVLVCSFTEEPENPNAGYSSYCQIWCMPMKSSGNLV